MQNRLNQASFEKLNSGMQSAYLTKWGRAIERNWLDEPDRRLQLQSFREFTKLLNHSLRIHQDMNELEFTSSIMKLEGQVQSSASDHEIIIESRDRKEARTENSSELFIVLDNIRSAFNVGSIFRTADGLGVKKILLCGFTPTPHHPKVMQTALGAEKSVQWQSFATLKEALETLGDVKKIAVETVKEAPLLPALELPKACAFILGNEKNGLSPEHLALADDVTRLPMHGLKNSLNVAVCVALCSYEYNRQNGKVD